MLTPFMSCWWGDSCYLTYQFLQNFVSTQAWARVQLNEEKNRKKLKTQRSNWRWFSASCSASFLRSHHVRCCRLELWGSWGIRGDHRQSDEADIRTEQPHKVYSWEIRVIQFKHALYISTADSALTKLMSHHESILQINLLLLNSFAITQQRSVNQRNVVCGSAKT